MSLNKLKTIIGKINDLEMSDILNIARGIREQLGTLTEFETFASPDGETNESLHYKDGRVLHVEYDERENLAPFFGQTIRCVIDGELIEREVAHVRKDLSKRVKRFVRSHELFHLIDESQSGGWAGSELRANLIPGLRDPLGLIATIKATLEDKERVQLYLDRIRNSF